LRVELYQQLAEEGQRSQQQLEAGTTEGRSANIIPPDAA